MKILNDIELKSNNSKLIEDYNDKNIYLTNISIKMTVKQRSGYTKEVNKLLKENLFCEYRFIESLDFFTNEIKRKLNIKIDKKIKIVSIFLIDRIGKATLKID